MTGNRRTALEAQRDKMGAGPFRKHWTSTSLPSHDPDLVIAREMIAEEDRQKDDAYRRRANFIAATAIGARA